MPVCARCFAIYLAGFITTLLFYLYPAYLYLKAKYLLWLCLPAVFDFLLGKANLYTDHLLIRFITGFMLGVSLFLLLNYSLANFPLKIKNGPDF